MDSSASFFFFLLFETHGSKENNRVDVEVHLSIFTRERITMKGSLLLACYNVGKDHGKYFYLHPHSHSDMTMNNLEYPYHGVALDRYSRPTYVFNNIRIYTSNIHLY